MPVFKLGFTGTQVGMTSSQTFRVWDIVKSLLVQFGSIEAHHGDCVGADAQFHGLVRPLGVKLSIHPPAKTEKRAFCAGDQWALPKGYLDRNKDIVDSCQQLIACPKTANEELRSGTWSTVRYARKQGVPCVIVLPDGCISTNGAVHGATKPEPTLAGR